jgi:hypothetical protein
MEYVACFKEVKGHLCWMAGKIEQKGPFPDFQIWVDAKKLILNHNAKMLSDENFEDDNEEMFSVMGRDGKVLTFYKPEMAWQSVIKIAFGEETRDLGRTN